MPNAQILLRAEANRLGIDGYKAMSQDELKAAIKSAKGVGSSPAKGKGTSASTNGASAAPTKGKGKVSPAKGKGTTATKTASKSSPAKSTTRKSSSKTTAAKGTAKRTATAAGKGRAKASATKAKAPAAKGRTTATRKTGAAKNAPARVNIDRSQIDWRAESNVGRIGKRADVMASLRKRKGNYDKVYEDLEPMALKWYPNALNTYPHAPNKKYAAQLMLRWLINRVALDFVRATEQHTSGVRQGYGKSKKPSDVARREQRAEAAKLREKAERAAKRGKGK